MKKKLTTQKKFVGGVVKANDDGFSNFQTIVGMLFDPNCVVTCVSYASTRGFVFKLHLPGNIHFKGFNQDTNNFDIDVDTLIIKLVILSETEHRFEGFKIDQKEYPKFSDKLTTVKEEVVTQSEVYSKTLTKGEPFCPAIVDFSVFSSYTEESAILAYLKNKSTSDAIATYMIEYLTEKIEPGSFHVDVILKLGMISMESAIEYETYGNVMKRYPRLENLFSNYYFQRETTLTQLFEFVYNEKTTKAFGNIQPILDAAGYIKNELQNLDNTLDEYLLRLTQEDMGRFKKFEHAQLLIIIKWVLIFVYCNFLHCDLNFGNVLLKWPRDDEDVMHIKIKIIDFGMGFKTTPETIPGNIPDIIRFAKFFSWGLLDPPSSVLDSPLTILLGESLNNTIRLDNNPSPDSVLELIKRMICLEKSYLCVKHRTFKDSSKILGTFYNERFIFKNCELVYKKIKAFETNTPNGLGAIKYRVLTMDDNFTQVAQNSHITGGGKFSKTFKKRRKKTKKRKTNRKTM